jgi:hypothetical protein
MNPIFYIPTSELSLYNDVHRSGWNFVINNLYNSQLVAKPSESYDPEHDSTLTFLDTYLDRTFHWDLNLLVAKGQLPYTRNWVGFLHHTFNNEYSAYNSTALFANQYFIDSLPYCQGIITLSVDMQINAQQALYNLSQLQDSYSNFINIHVNVLIHPTQDIDNKFTMDKLLSNDNLQLVQVGYWLRDMYAIYKLPDTSIFNIQKTLLVTNNAEDVIKPSNFDAMFEYYDTDTEKVGDLEINVTVPYTDAEIPDPTSNEAYYTNLPAMCRDISSSGFGGNKFVKGVFDQYKLQESQVNVISYLNNDDFDTLLSQNVVFLQLKDASAVNTLIECIIRNTPIIVNPLPAVVEYLGPDYPYYYDQTNAFQVNQSNYNLFSIRTIQQTYNYLNRMDKTKFQMETFISNFESFFTS